MKEYMATLKISVEDEELEKYTDVSELIYSNTEEVPFSFSIEDIHECN